MIQALKRRLQSMPWWDIAICAALFVGYTSWLLATVDNLGYSRDEGFYFQASDTYLKWFKLLGSDPAAALERANVDRYWRSNHEHPALIKSLFALSRSLFYDGLGWFSERGTSYRFVGMLFGSFSLALIYTWARQALRLLPASVAGSEVGVWPARLGGLVAALGFAFMPRIFYHAHLDCFDIPVLSMWLVTTYAYWRSVKDECWGWALATAVLYGLLLNTKHNSWLLPFALVAHVLLTKGLHLWRELIVGRVRIPLSLVLMASLSPLLFYATWPWIWFDTGERLAEYVKFHTAHVYYNIEFLGQTYFQPPFPRSYAWVMTATTVPAVTLLLSAIGLTAFARSVFRQRLVGWWRRWRSSGLRQSLGTNERLPQSHQQWESTLTLWLLCVVVSYAPWLSSGSPIFGGTKHWATAYPYLCMFGSIGFVLTCLRLRQTLPAAAARGHWLEGGLAALVLAGPFVMTKTSHPWGLSDYTPLAGSTPGGASLGLNRSFWGYTTGAVQDFINDSAPKRARTFVHDTALQSWQMMARDGRLRKDLRPQLGVAGSKIGLYHHEQHMQRVEHQIWVDYGTVRPSHIGAHNGVPVIWVYERPKTKSAPTRNQ